MAPLRLVMTYTARVTVLALLLPRVAHAGGGPAMPWNTPLDTIRDNLVGPTARTLIVIGIVIGGLTWGFSRHEEGAKRIGQWIVGGAIALGAVAFVAGLGLAGALLR